MSIVKVSRVSDFKKSQSAWAARFKLGKKLKVKINPDRPKFSKWQRLSLQIAIVILLYAVDPL